MATTATLTYQNDNGDYITTYIRRVGNLVPEQLQEAFGMDYAAKVDFINQGSLRGGYRTVTEKDFSLEAEEARQSYLNPKTVEVYDGTGDMEYFLNKDGSIVAVDFVQILTHQIRINN